MPIKMISRACVDADTDHTTTTTGFSFAVFGQMVLLFQKYWDIRNVLKSTSCIRPEWLLTINKSPLSRNWSLVFVLAYSSFFRRLLSYLHSNMLRSEIDTIITDRKKFSTNSQKNNAWTGVLLSIPKAALPSHYCCKMSGTHNLEYRHTYSHTRTCAICAMEGLSKKRKCFGIIHLLTSWNRAAWPAWCDWV